MYRQGDILLRRSQVPAKARLADEKIVAYGEATGHTHRLEGDASILLDEAQMFVRAGANTRLVHDEHATIILPEGEYSVIRQREYDEGIIRYVSD